jgi:hypothetical protein
MMNKFPCVDRRAYTKQEVIMNRKRWEDLANFGLGLWVSISPWTIEHVMAGPGTSGTVTEAAMWNHYVVGLAVVIIAGAAASAWLAWEEWTNAVLGAWLVISPWMLGYSTSPGSDVECGNQRRAHCAVRWLDSHGAARPKAAVENVAKAALSDAISRAKQPGQQTAQGKEEV